MATRGRGWTSPDVLVAALKDLGLSVDELACNNIAMDDSGKVGWPYITPGTKASERISSRNRPSEGGTDVVFKSSPKLDHVVIKRGIVRSAPGMTATLGINETVTAQTWDKAIPQGNGKVGLSYHLFETMWLGNLFNDDSNAGETAGKGRNYFKTYPRYIIDFNDVFYAMVMWSYFLHNGYKKDKNNNPNLFINSEFKSTLPTFRNNREDVYMATSHYASDWDTKYLATDPHDLPPVFYYTKDTEWAPQVKSVMQRCLETDGSYIRPLLEEDWGGMNGIAGFSDSNVFGIEEQYHKDWINNIFTETGDVWVKKQEELQLGYESFFGLDGTDVSLSIQKIFNITVDFDELSLFPSKVQDGWVQENASDKIRGLLRLYRRSIFRGNPSSLTNQHPRSLTFAHHRKTGVYYSTAMAPSRFETAKWMLNGKGIEEYFYGSKDVQYENASGYGGSQFANLFGFTDMGQMTPYTMRQCSMTIAGFLDTLELYKEQLTSKQVQAILMILDFFAYKMEGDKRYTMYYSESDRNCELNWENSKYDAEDYSNGGFNGDARREASQAGMFSYCRNPTGWPGRYLGWLTGEGNDTPDQSATIKRGKEFYEYYRERFFEETDENRFADAYKDILTVNGKNLAKQNNFEKEVMRKVNVLVTHGTSKGIDDYTTFYSDDQYRPKTVNGVFFSGGSYFVKSTIKKKDYWKGESNQSKRALVLVNQIVRLSDKSRDAADGTITVPSEDILDGVGKAGGGNTAFMSYRTISKYAAYQEITTSPAINEGYEEWSPHSVTWPVGKYELVKGQTLPLEFETMLEEDFGILMNITDDDISQPAANPVFTKAIKDETITPLKHEPGKFGMPDSFHGDIDRIVENKFKDPNFYDWWQNDSDIQALQGVDTWGEFFTGNNDEALTNPWMRCFSYVSTVMEKAWIDWQAWLVIVQSSTKNTIQQDAEVILDATANVVTQLYLADYHRHLTFLKWVRLQKEAEKNEKEGAAQSLNPSEIKKIADDAAAAARRNIENEIINGSQPTPGAEAADVAKEYLTEQKIKDREKFFNQCALLLNMDKLKDAYQKQIKNDAGSRIHKRAPFENRFYVLGDKSKQYSKFLNRIIMSPMKQVEPFLNITPEIHALLVPKISLYNIVSNKSGGVLREIPFAFKNYEDPNRINALLKSSFDKGNSGGIKQFDLTFDGTNPATARKDIKAKLKMYFQSFQDFIKKRNIKITNPKGEIIENVEWKYVDLLLFQGGNTATRNEYDAKHFRIRADVGWHLLPNTSEINAILAKRGTNVSKFNSALTLINKSYYLNLIDHSIDIRPDGSVEITADYAAWMESETKSPTMDALSSPALIERRSSFAKEYKEAIHKTDCSDAQLNELRATFNQIEQRYIQATYQSIMKRMLDRGSINNIRLRRNSVENFSKNGTPPKIEGVVRFGATRFKSPDMSKTEDVVQFFYMGDLIYTLLDCFYGPSKAATQKNPLNLDNTTGKKRQEYESYKLLLAPFIYDAYQSASGDNIIKSINMAEIPISTNFFNEWMTEMVVKPDRRSYPLTYFIRDLATKLIVEMFSETCINREVERKLMIQTANILAPKKKVKNKRHEAFSLCKKIDKYYIDVVEQYKKRDSILPLAGGGDPGLSILDYTNYYLMYGISNSNVAEHPGRGDPHADGEDGIYHFLIGANRGLVKNISFSKTDMMYLREARFMRHGMDGLAQLSAVYNAKVDMIGNTIYYPGMEIWIDPSGVGGLEFKPQEYRSIANTLGLGGYHMVKRVNLSITPGGFTTSLDALFTYSGDGYNRLFGAQRTDDKKKTIDVKSKRNSQATQACTNLIKEKQAEILAIREEQNIDKVMTGRTVIEPASSDPESETPDSSTQTDAPVKPTITQVKNNPTNIGSLNNNRTFQNTFMELEGTFVPLTSEDEASYSYIALSLDPDFITAADRGGLQTAAPSGQTAARPVAALAAAYPEAVCVDFYKLRFPNDPDESKRQEISLVGSIPRYYILESAFAFAKIKNADEYYPYISNLIKGSKYFNDGDVTGENYAEDYMNLGEAMKDLADSLAGGTTTFGGVISVPGQTVPGYPGEYDFYGQSDLYGFGDGGYGQPADFPIGNNVTPDFTGQGEQPQ